MEITFWHWLILGVVLTTLEIVLPGTYLLWPGIAALLTGLVALALPALPWQGAAGLFAALAVVAAIAGHGVYRRLRRPVDRGGPLNQRGQSLTGTVATLATPIVDGHGRIELGGTWWKVVGNDLPAGSRVIIVGVDGNALLVEKSGA